MAYPLYDSTRWKHRCVTLQPDSFEPIRIAYIDCEPRPDSLSKRAEAILLIHGFPQSSYQFRHVITPLADAGYRIIAPNYRGAGTSSKPTSKFTKTIMAQDMLQLLDLLGLSTPVHVVGHDIGGMIAYAFASRYPHRVASVIWGECPLPGTSIYDADRTMHAVQQFHFIFHSVPDLPEALVAGRERIYLEHFFSKISYNMAAISAADLDHYVGLYSQPGAMRCAFGVYRAFETDAEENRQWVGAHGKCKVPAMAFSGEKSRSAPEAQRMFEEVHDGSIKIAVVEEASHYLAEENPKGFVREVLKFVEKHSSK